MPSDPVAAPAGPSRVLVVDDDRNLTDVVERYLSREGFEVDVVEARAGGISVRNRAGGCEFTVRVPAEVPS